MNEEKKSKKLIWQVLWPIWLWPILAVILIFTSEKINRGFPVSGVVVALTFLAANAKALKAYSEKGITAKELFEYGWFISMFVFVTIFCLFAFLAPRI